MLHAAQGVTRPATDKAGGRPMATLGRVLPYLLSWGVLAALMIVGMNRLPLTLYTPMDGEWAKWNVEAILHFGKVFDLSPYSMLAGMGSMYFPNLPWLNPGALALALPLEDNTEEHRFLRRLRRRAGDQHHPAGACARLSVADRHGRRADLSLCSISTFLGGIPDL
jgi:hypothetical protein